MTSPVRHELSHKYAAVVTFSDVGRRRWSTAFPEERQRFHVERGPCLGCRAGNTMSRSW